MALGILLGDRVGVGITGRYLKVDQSGVGPLGFSQVAGGLQNPNAAANPVAPSRLALVNAVNFDVGVLVKLSDNVFLGGVGQNLAYTANGFMPSQVGGGIGFVTEAFTLEADGLADLNSWSLTSSPKPTAQVQVGAEYVASAVVPIRAGFGYNQGASLATAAVGSGLVYSGFTAEASVKRALSNPGTTMLTFGLSYSFDGGRSRATSVDDP